VGLTVTVLDHEIKISDQHRDDFPFTYGKINDALVYFGSDGISVRLSQTDTIVWNADWVVTYQIDYNTPNATEQAEYLVLDHFCLLGWLERDKVPAGLPKGIRSGSY
jgi:hypothetical protein